MTLHAALQQRWQVVSETNGAYLDGVWSATLETAEVVGVLQRLTPRQMEALSEGQKEARVEWTFLLHGGTRGLNPAIEGRTDGTRRAGSKADRLIGPLDVVDKHARNVFEVYELAFEDAAPWHPQPIRHARYLLRLVTPPIGGEEVVT